ncbi:ABC transporter permease [Blattabacterium cuenoti]|uniref:ABC transporter permease n=1 Tax=Blattabacterium cuenoti TaxID=1653831 RepID=UPI00163BA8D1|nr:FtsX-like permease family protein [Blattabacterium cuenoti]
MKNSFYIAKRYFLSKKKTSLVNLIVFLSILSFSVSTFSMSTILFVFSGLENLTKNFYNRDYPDITISSLKKKDFFIDEKVIKKIKQIKEIKAFSKSLEKPVCLYYNNKEYFFYLKGIDKKYEKIMGKFKKIELKKNNNKDYDHINLYVDSFFIEPYIPILLQIKNNYSYRILIFSEKKKGNIFIPFIIKKKFFIKGIFWFNKEIDKKYLFCELYEIQKAIKKKIINILEIKIFEKKNIYNIKKRLMNIFGPNFNIVTSLEKEKYFYKIINTEKIFIYFLFILMTLITGFNLFNSIFVLQLDKKEEFHTFWYIGYPLYKIKRISFCIGLLITFIGWFIGMFFSIVISLIQNSYKIFYIDMETPFPIKITIVDFYMTTFFILILGIIISFFSSKKMNSMIL